MARKIAKTPTLEGKDAVEFLKEMNRPNTKEEDEHWKKIQKNHRIKFL